MLVHSHREQSSKQKQTTTATLRLRGGTRPHSLQVPFLFFEGDLIQVLYKNKIVATFSKETIIKMSLFGAHI